jgi:hypothetical protein
MIAALLIAFASVLALQPQSHDETLLTADERNALETLKKLGFRYSRESDGDYPRGTTLAYEQLSKYKRPPVLGAKELEALGRLKRLRLLNLAYAPINDEVTALIAPMSDLQQLCVGATPITDAGLKRLDRLRKLQVLFLTDTAISGAGIGPVIDGAPDLRELHLCGTQIADDGLKKIGHLQKLRRLDLDKAPVTDKGIQCLSKCATLEILSLAQTKVTDASMQAVADLPALASLGLEGCQAITGKGFAAFEGNGRLLTLGLRQTKVGDEAAPSLGKLLAINNLFLNYTQLTDKGLMELARPGNLPRLRLLNIGHTAVSDDGLRALHDMKCLATLTHLEVTGTRVTRKGIEALNGARPNLHVSR